MSKKVCLVILDGWGNGKKDHTDAIYNADTPFVDGLYSTHPYSSLLTDGLNVGLPKGQMGNSEVGHMNIGAGRIVYQDLVRINRSIEDRSFYRNETLVKALTRANVEGRKVHFMGLIGHGGVHASQNHLLALCKLSEELGLPQVFVHAFMDGRDTDPNSGIGFMQELERDIQGTPARISTIIGRYFAMDRDKRWERVKKAYDLLVNGIGEPANSAIEGIQDSYNKGVTDEFIEPIVVNQEGEYQGKIEDNDLVVCFNFRTDRCREITEVLTQRNEPNFGMKVLDLDYITMTSYDDTYEGVKVLFDKDSIPNTLGEYVSSQGKTQLRIAETEKYPHVSFFFSGGREKKFRGESRIMVPSPKVATYDLKPEMSAYEVRDEVIGSMKGFGPDFICLNFANPDMVGHTGVFDAIIKACETVDSCLKDVVVAGRELGYSFVIIADHGNADNAVNLDGSPNTAHSLNPVPVIVIDDNVEMVNDGILADVAPTILSLLNLDQPTEMTGKSLV